MLMRFVKDSSNIVKLYSNLIVILLINIITEVTHFYEAKYIAVIFYGFFAKSEWGDEKKDLPKAELKTVWKMCGPFLFGSIGAAVNIFVI